MPYLSVTADNPLGGFEGCEYVAVDDEDNVRYMFTDRWEDISELGLVAIMSAMPCFIFGSAAVNSIRHHA